MGRAVPSGILGLSSDEGAAFESELSVIGDMEGN